MASGQTLFVKDALDRVQPSSNYALDYETSNGRRALSFDPTTNQTVFFEAFLPRNYVGTTGITGTILWAPETATSGTCIWKMYIERCQVGTDVVDTDSYASAQSVTTTAPGVTKTATTSSIAFTSGAQMDSAVGGEWVRVKLERDAATDNMGGLALFFGVEFRET